MRLRRARRTAWAVESFAGDAPTSRDGRSRPGVRPWRSLVARVTVAVVGLVQVAHESVARDLGDDRGRRDGGARRIAADDPALGHGQLRNAEGVDEHEIGQRRQLEDGAAHGVERRPMNVAAIDVGRRTVGDGPRTGTPANHLVEAFACRLRQLLRVAQPGDGPRGVEHDGRRDHGPGEAPTTDFVRSRHEDEAPPPHRVFDRARCAGRGHASDGSGRSPTPWSASVPSCGRPCP